MKWSGVPEVATPRVMTQALATLYLFGGSASLLAVLGSSAAWSDRAPVAGLAISALTAGAVVFRFGARWPRPAFHLAVAQATVVVVAGVVLAADAPTAVAVGALTSFLAIAACFFFSLPLAVLHIAFALIGLTGGLLAQGDVALPTALSLDAMVIGLSVVTRGLVLRASSANRDPLTRLTNRRGFDQALHELMRTVARTGEPLSAALLDLDHFKAINDTQGHAAGDRVLRQVAKVWGRALPTTAVLARHGGDEFALLLPGVPGPAALELVRSIRAMHPEIGMSCGVAEHQPGESAAQLMRRSDLALYTAKAAGRGRVELGAGPRSSDLVADLTAALDAGDVTVHFQPMLDLSTDEVVGVEALARWTHPERGPVSPAEFIAVAEQHGLMGRLGEQVVRSACTQLAALRAETGRQLRLGVNVSGRELSDPAYCDRLRRVFAETGWSASETVLEVTETLVEAESSAAVAALHQLRALGLRIAIDDFGTGYSSLSRLDTLPAAILKLDSSFIATVATSPRRATLLRSIVGMAHVLGLDVVAEGVETPAQDAELRAAGCRFGQGYLYGRPAPLADLAALLERRTERTPALRG
ncbi:bifunctional diguanylate cyclase/phosphodiesterase [Blastococcus sp. TML/M2B]|uniref:putative bifunctional diguanylate cyclase/phosphodiesterase n=1 Tax=unclassified Blastococcus TaxID=2619396 RepID=UPI00190DB6E7|nr:MULTISPECIES: bifunctional diguanylate cyclase/phosphodiesterase [unclassified Blastococcus]MBN1093347.1 bifunctional diguanylate cyclase/phosphodiesterase [Blastococcus sp. TML/M2B]MBN1096538.1 bifunctional diguanylate cyclase/phosphodiesterase [Blastococcus sp. TML/C7B]